MLVEAFKLFAKRSPGGGPGGRVGGFFEEPRCEAGVRSRHGGDGWKSVFGKRKGERAALRAELRSKEEFALFGVCRACLASTL